MSHITGGGFYENIPRALPKGLSKIDTQSFPTLEVFNWLQNRATFQRMKCITYLIWVLDIQLLLTKRCSNNINNVTQWIQLHMKLQIIKDDDTPIHLLEVE